MQKQIVWVLLSVLALMLIVLTVLESTDRPATMHSDQKLFPDLSSQLEDLRAVTLVRSDQTVELNYDGYWQVANRDNFPADFGRVQALGSALATARLLEAKTARPENHARLGLSEEGVDDEVAVQVTLTLGNGAIFAVLVGKEAQNRAGRYIRRAGDDQSWLIDTAIDVSTSLSDWLSRDLLNVEYDRIASFARIDKNGESFSASRATPDASAFDLNGAIPEGKQLSYETVLNAVARVPGNLRIDDLSNQSETPVPEAGQVITRFSTFDGLMLTLAMWRDETGNWVSVEARADEQAQLDQEQLETRQAEIEEISKRVTSRVFRIADYQASELEKSLGEYLNDLTPASEDSNDG